MADLYGLSLEDIELLRRDHDKLTKLPENPRTFDTPKSDIQTQDILIARTPCGQPIVRMNESLNSISWQDCCIFKLTYKTDANDPTRILVPYLDSDGKPVRKRVYNIFPQDIPDCAYFKIFRTKSGWWVSENPDWISCSTTTTTLVPTSSTSSTTSTTPGIGSVGTSYCSGTCKWTWTASTRQWSLTTNGCNTTTSTSTSTTTTAAPSSSSSSSSTSSSSTSSTTTTPCACPTSSTSSTSTSSTTPHVSTSSSSTSSSTTTTTPAPCQCAAPHFCGTFDGECTLTFCTSFATSFPINCPTTTTLPPGVTTTTCNCGTTTTTAAPTTTTLAPTCNPYCTWVSLPGIGGGWGWYIKDYCGSDGYFSGIPYGGGAISYFSPYCQRYCNYPSISPTSCATTLTDCNPIPQTTTTTIAPFCAGICTYWWIPSVSQWYQTANTCNQYQMPGCQCIPPSSPGSICAPWGGGCGVPTTTTLIPTTSTSTTQIPCINCRSTTSTTTTTPSPCSWCKWRWNNGLGQWSIVLDYCGGGCPCTRPSYVGTADCETAIGGCGPTTTSSSTTTSTSSSTTSSTTSSSTSSSSTSTSTSTTSSTTSSSTSTTTTTPAPGCLDCNQPETDFLRQVWTTDSGGTSNLCNSVNDATGGCTSFNDATYIRLPKNSLSDIILKNTQGVPGGVDRVVTGFRLYARAKDDSAFAAPSVLHGDVGYAVSGSYTSGTNGGSDYVSISTSAFTTYSVSLTPDSGTVGKTWNWWLTNGGFLMDLTGSTDDATGSTHFLKVSQVWLKVCWGGSSP